MTNNNSVAVSICIVSYNTKDFLSRCINSIQAKTNIAYEIIIVDNNSADGTAEFLLQKKQEVRVILNKQNLGFARAVNQAVNIARGEYILILNPDTEIINSAIDKCLAYIRTKTAKDIVTCKILNSDGSVCAKKKGADFYSLKTQLFLNLRLYKIFPNHQILSRAYFENYDYNKPQIFAYTEGCFIMVNKEFFENIGLFDERFFLYAEDCDLCERIKKVGGKIYYFPGAKIIHHGGGSANSAITEIHHQFFLNRYKFYKKYYGLSGARIYKGILFIGSILKIMMTILDIIFKGKRNYKRTLKINIDVLLWLVGIKCFKNKII